MVRDPSYEWQCAQANIPYGTAVGNMNRVGYGAKISHGVKMGDSNFIDSGAQIGNFVEF